MKTVKNRHKKKEKLAHSVYDYIEKYRYELYLLILHFQVAHTLGLEIENFLLGLNSLLPSVT